LLFLGEFRPFRQFAQTVFRIIDLFFLGIFHMDNGIPDTGFDMGQGCIEIRDMLVKIIFCPSTLSAEPCFLPDPGEADRECRLPAGIDFLRMLLQFSDGGFQSLLECPVHNAGPVQVRIKAGILLPRAGPGHRTHR
jgi:hypothetical protein